MPIKITSNSFVIVCVNEHASEEPTTMRRLDQRMALWVDDAMLRRTVAIQPYICSACHYLEMYSGDADASSMRAPAVGKLPSDRISDIAPEFHGEPNESGGRTASVTWKDVARFLDERLGRSP